MAVQPSDAAARDLALRLRELREREWPGVTITQPQLAEALKVSPPLISSWESRSRPAIPPEVRLVDYATFFATPRSAEQTPFRILREDELTDDERARRDQLLRELTEARQAAAQRCGAPAEARGPAIAPLSGPWQFRDEKPITMVCAELPPEQRERMPQPEDPEGAYADLYAYADLDALFELHGHIRAANPTSLVKVRASSALGPDDYTDHLVVLGGVDWNRATRQLLGRLHIPVEQASGDSDGATFQVSVGDATQQFEAERARDGSLIADIGHFFRAPNPYNHKRTVTICNGLTSRGVLGAVRALTDERFRDRNGDYVKKRFAGADTYSILMRIQVLGVTALTPDWTLPEVRLHEWPGSDS